MRRWSGWEYIVGEKRDWRFSGGIVILQETDTSGTAAQHHHPANQPMSGRIRLFSWVLAVQCCVSLADDCYFRSHSQITTTLKLGSRLYHREHVLHGKVGQSHPHAGFRIAGGKKGSGIQRGTIQVSTCIDFSNQTQALRRAKAPIGSLICSPPLSRGKVPSSNY
ncbi:hypothetical protein CIHG_03917 [Coccidioides immitis H538.4]|uniref:Uncharacterized protein n=1 Tax=Coccidioides immitis H538.4 TaxID=396776 RepID=A0A0J8RM09_COCIT|nr:hypothetical protein CIHG_03917 [Coccidioides immitis H538.4]